MGTYYLKQQWTEVTYNADTGLYEKELRYVDQYGNAHGGVSVYRADEPSKLPQVEYPEEVAYTADALAVLTGGGTGAITAKILGKNALMKAVEGGALAYGRNEIEELLGLPNGIEEILKTVYDTFFREDYNVDYSQISCVFEPENSDEIFRDTLTSTDGTLDNFTLNSEKPNGAVEVLNWDNTGVLYENGAVTATLTLSDADGGKTYSFVDPDGQPTGNSITTFPTGETRSTYQDGTVTLFYPEDETEDPSQVYSITTQPNGIVETRTWDDTGTITELGGTVVAGTVTYGGDYKEVTLMEGGNRPVWCAPSLMAVLQSLNTPMVIPRPS